MNLLAHLVCSRVRAEIFRVLFGLRGEPVHLRDLQRQSGLSLSTVRQDVEKLTQLGLVQRRRAGNRLYYSANDSHPLAMDIRHLVLKTVGLSEVLRVALRTDGVRCAFVFGSAASGDMKAESDIDLMIIGSIGLRKASSLLSGMGERLGREINPHVLPPSEFSRRIQAKDHFVSSVMEAAKVFVVGTANDLEAMVR